MTTLSIQQDPPAGVVLPDSHAAGYDHEGAARNRKRIRIFLSVLCISLLASLSYTFLRPAIYESRATLLVIPPLINERAGEVANTQYVDLEIQYLKGHAILSAVRGILSSTSGQNAGPEITLPELQEMLVAESIEGTNLISLSAEGSGRELLPLTVNAWVDAYQNAHREAIQSASESESTEINKQLEEMKAKVEKKRLALDTFRKEYDIVSLERNENRVLKKLNGLTDSLNTANEEKVAARARLGAIRAAISEGRPVVNSSGRDSLTNLEDRLIEIQEQLKDLENEFTPRYMSVDPKIKGLVRKREMLEQEIRNKRLQGQQLALAEAEQEYASASQTVISLQQQLEEHKQQALEFTTRFAEHEALQEELLQLETAYREVQDRQLQMQVDSRRQYPQITVKERAILPERPSHPDYLRDAAISAGGSLMVALLLLWLYDFLTRPARRAAGHEIKQVFVTSAEHGMLGRPVDVSLPHQAAVPALEHQSPRELSEAEVRDLLGIAGPDIRLLLVCLLSGMTAEEVRNFQWGDIDTDAGQIRIRGRNERSMPATPPLMAAVKAVMPDSPDSSSTVWPEAGSGLPTPDDMAAMLLYTAHDAGLTRSMEVTPEAVRHTYIAHLVRKGVRLGDLARLVGEMPPATLAAYGVYSPPGSAMSLDTVESVYPVLVAMFDPLSDSDITPASDEST